MRCLLAVFLWLGLVSVSFGDDKQTESPIPLEKWNLGHLEKAWGLKVKSIKHVPQDLSYFFVVDFGRDLEESELKSLREALPKGQGATGGVSKTLALYYFDKDNVVLEQSLNMASMSEITGKKGDAFRIRIAAPSTAAQNVAKVELRPIK